MKIATTPVRGPSIIGPWRPEGAHWSAVGEAILVTGSTLKVYDVSSCSAPCYADCDRSGSLDIFDFLCFQDAFGRGDPLADCDSSNGPGVLDLLDLLCFQEEFLAGAPTACDCDTSSGPGVCDILDFLCFQDAFLTGCD